MSKRTQECISTAHCLMSAPAAGSWDIMLCFTQKQTFVAQEKANACNRHNFKGFQAEAREILPKNKWRIVDVLREMSRPEMN